MKKIFAAIMTICLLASTLCITAFAEEKTPAPDTVLRISALNKSGTPIIIEDHNNFEVGWEAAIDYAEDDDYMNKNKYDRIVVDLFADWQANDDGEFGSGGDGFEWNTIHITADIRITLNLNDHTINRNLKEWENNGEVIYIDEDADVIINNGTITGGWSANGAGAIHIKDDANVVLNNVNIVGNKVDDDNGAGIAVLDGATLTMKGGCVSKNASYNEVYGGGVYVEEAKAFLSNVTFSDNQGMHRSTHGAAIYVDDGVLVMEECSISGNGLASSSAEKERRVAFSIISLLNGSEATLKNTTFSENGCGQETAVSVNSFKYTTVINTVASYLTMEKCSFKANNQVYLIQSEATALNALDSDFTENNSFAFYGNCASGYNSAFTKCKFDYNEPMLSLEHTFYFNTSNASLSFVDCQLGKATFNNKNAAKFVYTGAQAGSVFGEGSLTMIVALLALITSAVSIFLTVYYNKRKAENNVEETEI